MQPDSVRNNYKFTITTIDSLPVFENSDFARFKVKYQSIILDKKDTLLGSWDYRLLFEDGSWKIIWFGRMASIASDHLQNQQYDQSLVLYMVICAVDPPDDPTAHTLLGDLYGSAEQFDKAIEAYSKAIEIKPEPVFYVNLGSVYKMNGQFVEADDSYRKSIELDSLSPQGWWMLGELYLYNLDDRAMAKTFYNKALQLKPMSDYYQMRLYYGYALLLYSDAVETDPDEISADEREWLQEAKTYIGKALKIDPRSSEFSYLSNEINKQLMGS
jgi:tetratricopeptide (TPR) repeat protein